MSIVIIFFILHTKKNILLIYYNDNIIERNCYLFNCLQETKIKNIKRESMFC